MLKQEIHSTRERPLLIHYISAVLSNLKASQMGEKPFLLLRQCENQPYYQHFLVHWKQRSLARAVPYLPSESKSFIKVDGGSDLFYSLKEEGSYRAAFYPLDV